ncbi:NACHT domain-containing protein [Streptomyces rubiginosohelvolus]|uniref:NACHT domain-containing protein n=1 Tax=Streptomyces rubiginosohelvolus TaxID=67362 RepID=UPI0035DCD130
MEAKREQRIHTVLRYLNPLLAVVTVGSLLWTVRTLGKGGLEPGDTAGVVAVPLAALAAWLGTVAILRRRPETEASASRLAGLVQGAERAALARLLGFGAPLIDLRFRAPDTPGGEHPRTGAVDHVRALHPRRVVITGESGAGKSVLAGQVILALLETRRAGAPVPVRIAATAWEPGRPFDVWFAEQISRRYALSAAEARVLVTGHHVMPVIDGVDEMGATHAAALLDQLSTDRRNMDQRPVILTCRTGPYERLREEHPVTNTHHITVEPLDGAQSAAFLAGHPRVAPNAERWAPVLADLRAAPEGPLAQALASPWRLTLAATAYAHDPADLVGRAASGDLHEHLLARYIPATVRLHFAEEDERGYAEEDVARWLSELAWHVGLRGAESVEAAREARLLRDGIENHHRARRARVETEERARQALAAHDGTGPDLDNLREAADRVAADVRALDAQHLREAGELRRMVRSDEYAVGSIVPGRLWTMAAPRRIRAMDALLCGTLPLVGWAVAWTVWDVRLPEPTPWWGHALPWAGGVFGGLAGWLAYRQRPLEAPMTDLPSLRRGRERRRLTGLALRALLRVVAVPSLFAAVNAAASALDVSDLAASLAGGAVGAAAFALLPPWRPLLTLPPLPRTMALLAAAFCVCVGGATGTFAASMDVPIVAIMTDIGAVSLIPSTVWFVFHRAWGAEPDPWGTRRRTPQGGILAEVIRATAAAALFTVAVCWPLFLLPGAVPFLDVTPTALVVTGAAILVPTAVLQMPTPRRYLHALLLLQPLVPFRLGRFLKWAYGAGLLRTEGPAYQFRHRELYEWLILSYYERGPEAVPRGYVTPPR